MSTTVRERVGNTHHSSYSTILQDGRFQLRHKTVLIVTLRWMGLRTSNALFYVSKKLGISRPTEACRHRSPQSPRTCFSLAPRPLFLSLPVPSTRLFSW